MRKSSCGLYCAGGSELRKCKCLGPAQCEFKASRRFVAWSASVIFIALPTLLLIIGCLMAIEAVMP